MLTIASLLHRKSIASLSYRKSLSRPEHLGYTPGIYGVFDGDELLAAFPRGTPLDLACASIALENARGLPDASEKLKALMELEAREGNVDATSWLQRYYPDENSDQSGSSDAPAP